MAEVPRWSPADRRHTEAMLARGGKLIEVAKRCELMEELCRLFHSKPDAMMCAVAHGQLSIDGYVIRPRHLRRWTRDQLVGRYARLCGRWAQLYGSTPVQR